MNMKFVLCTSFMKKNKFSEPRKLGFITFGIRIYKSHLLQHLNYQPFFKKCSFVGHCGSAEYISISNRAQTLYFRFPTFRELKNEEEQLQSTPLNMDANKWEGARVPWENGLR